MTKAIQPFKTSQPNYEVVTGKFCYPKPIAPGGTISADETKARPLIVGTDVTIDTSGGLFRLTLVADLTDWGINVGDFVNFKGTGIDGSYSINTINGVTAGDTILLNGPAQAVTTGYIWFDKLDQQISGTNTKFTKWVVGQKYIAVINDSLTPTVQVCKISRVVSDTELYVEKGFITAIADEAFLLTEGALRGVSINCGGAGVVMGEDVATDDIFTFYQDSGLEPVYGDSGANTFKILIQK